MIYLCKFPITHLYLLFSSVVNEIEDSQIILLCFPNPSTLYVLPGGLGDSSAGGVAYGVSLALDGEVGAGDRFLRGRGAGARGGVECDPQMERWGGGGAGGVDVEEVTRHEIKCCQYLSSRAKCAHVLSAPVISTPSMMRPRL